MITEHAGQTSPRLSEWLLYQIVLGGALLGLEVSQFFCFLSPDRQVPANVQDAGAMTNQSATKVPRQYLGSTD